ncbi:AhpC/TSA family protein [Parabacteroides sp. 52]|uniref:TlpA disulfide reductase family protein n=1 Tax=unclassified Parabacteroides TaxID=2649774 RepID=UPI0013CFE212|nr:MULTISPECIES: TlpA disulfide reductase family protein [unclassified Parabacteroides]MDH6534391.1 peroxiredoxin [Parabacteroides sp. PM5-20]NDV54890.1 AhpC/TSA family protein [Parabacteroides sp. 52]
MKQKALQLLSVFGMLLLLCNACTNKSDFTVTGVVSGADGQMMYLENVGVSSVLTLDSVKLGSNGKFNFAQPKPGSPEFYRLRLNNQWINFAIDSTETVTFQADAGTFAISYMVEGSENSKAIKNITLAQLDANQALNKLRKEHEGKQINDSVYVVEMQEIAKAYKEVALKYIYTAPMSTAAYFALFQQIDGMLFFDMYDRTDSKAFAAVATSYDHYYPKSARSMHLHNLALQSIKVTRAQKEINLDDVNVQKVTYLDIALSDINGKEVKLSDIAEGKVVLINFTAFQTEWSPALNMNLGELYTQYHEKGLEIYQVSLDTDRHIWRNAALNLPWIAVLDPQSVYSQIAALYNVKQLPALFLLDRKGNLTKRIEDIEKLEADIKKLL